MRIGVISDTHGNSQVWQQAWQQVLADCDLILHAGDILAPGPRNPITAGYNPPALAEALNSLTRPWLAVRGNCDAEVDEMMLARQLPPLTQVYTSFGLLVITHGHQYDGPAGLIKLAKQQKARVVISGHTHVPVLLEQEGTFLLNPGSPTLPKEDWPPTLAVVTERGIQLLNLQNGAVIKEINW
ncbi:phosphodiesterase [Carboxydocella sp. JDF658]|uniref:phosphodiesterase n=1 Tax=Carboxydocella sp. JDF658 TaxID=1926600 RepID=UPI0009AF1A05|nr:phosphodiesterase [Carboxydocella sp. JDF658]GAW30970.1 hypothetical protein JDF658_07350 [Carboxydocella sp. JDF658]